MDAVAYNLASEAHDLISEMKSTMTTMQSEIDTLKNNSGESTGGETGTSTDGANKRQTIDTDTIYVDEITNTEYKFFVSSGKLVIEEL
jgi:hypothetical protein